MTPAQWTLAQLASLIGAELHSIQPERIVRRMASDSRTMQTEPALFWALTTASGDGHRHLEEALDRGCLAAVVSVQGWADHPVAGLDVLVVDDVWSALYLLAAAHRAAFTGTVVAITGSNGKTSVKEQLAHLMADPSVVRSPRSYNSKLGVPLSVLQFPLDASIWLVEVGVSEAGGMARFTPWLKPTHGIFTGIGDAHDEGFADRAQKLREKKSLFEGVTALVVPEDRVHEGMQSPLRSEGGFWIGPDGQRFAQAQDSQAERSNAFLALTACYILGRVPRNFETRPCGPLRLERRPARWGGSLLIDRYALDEASVEEALGLLAQEDSQPKTAVIFDADFGRWKPALEGWAKRYPMIQIDLAHPQDSAPGIAQSGAVLLKGHGVEAALEARLARQHDSLVEIDLDALEANLRHYRSLLPPQTRVMAMIKANGYGLGAVVLARALERHRVHYLGVAYPEEGRELREAGIRSPIMVLNPGDPSFELMLRHRLEPELFSWERLAAFAEAYGRYPEALGDVLVHIKVDSGMHRLGFEPHEGRAVAQALAKLPGVRVASVLSHFAAAEDPQQDDFSRAQWDAFSRFADDLEGELQIKVWRHMANSPAVARHPWAAGDMVRLGIGLMGASPVASDAKQLQPVVKVTTTLSQLRKVPAGQGISYGRSDSAPHERLIATLPIGYADGIPRALSNGRGQAYAKGHFMPIVGRVCMDMLMVDATNTDLRVGDRVELLGRHILLEDFAKSCGTISYEVLTGLSPRLPRMAANGL